MQTICFRWELSYSRHLGLRVRLPAVKGNTVGGVPHKCRAFRESQTGEIGEFSEPIASIIPIDWSREE
jgi:hypothetical protein